MRVLPRRSVLPWANAYLFDKSLCYDVHMMPLVLFTAIVVLPILLGLLLRVNSALLFLAIASGALLQRALGDSTELAIATVVKDAPVSLIADIGLLVLPVILTFVFLRKSAKKSQVLLQFLPLITVGLAFAALLIPLLPFNLQTQIYQLSFGSIIRQSQDLVIGVAVAMNLLLAFRVFRHVENPKHGKHH
jgi:hypothetical protein